MRNEYKGIPGPSYGPMYAKSINITNVTNITNVAVFRGYGHQGKSKRRHGHREVNRKEKPPKLFRYGASCGMLDQDVVANMSNEELCCESVKALGYSARGFGSCVCGIAREVGGVGRDACNVVGAIGGGLFKALWDIIK